MNNKKIKIILMLAAMFFLAAGEAGAVYKPHSRLLLKNTAFSRSKPQGFGRLDRAGEQGIKKGEDVFLYMEVYNCRSSRPGKEYELNLVMDMDIYYENGQCVYSQKDVKSFSPKSIRDFTKTHIWIKIETTYLKPGEYKVEVNVRDENSDKEAFTLGKMRIY